MNINLKVNSNYNKKKYEIEFYNEHTSYFLAYWRQFGVERDFLLKYNVSQVKYFQFYSRGKTSKFNYDKQGAIIVCYSVSNKIKLYRPEINRGFNDDYNFKHQSKKFVFKEQSNSDIFGLKQLPDKQLDYLLVIR